MAHCSITRVRTPARTPRHRRKPKRELQALAVLLTMAIMFSTTAEAKEEKRQCSMGRDYLLYTPDEIDPEQTYWLVVGVHGAGGNPAGAGGVANWARTMDNVIVVAPAFPSKGPYYQVLGGKSDEQLIGIVRDLHREFKLHKKFFIHGFSGGSQFAHRFASKYYKLLIGVSAHSGGSWDDAPHPGGVMFPWTVSCGLKDTGKSTSQSKHSRIDYFRNFYQQMYRNNFTAKAFVTDAGHSPTREVMNNAAECFRVGTTGMFDYQRTATKDMTPQDREAWLRQDKSIETVPWTDGQNTYQRKVNPDGWTVNRITLREMAKTRRMMDQLEKRGK